VNRLDLLLIGFFIFLFQFGSGNNTGLWFWHHLLNAFVHNGIDPFDFGFLFWWSGTWFGVRGQSGSISVSWRTLCG